MSCNKFTTSKLSKFCFKCDPRHKSINEKNIKVPGDASEKKKQKIRESTIESTNCQFDIKQKGVLLVEQSFKKLPFISKTSLYQNIKKSHEKVDDLSSTYSNIEMDYAKLENPGLNFCFLNSAVQFILSIKPLADLLNLEYVKKYCSSNTFLNEFEQLELIENPNRSIFPLTLAKKNFLFEFESLAINMIRYPKNTFSAARLARVFEELEKDYIYGNQWDCSSVVDLFLTLYYVFICQEIFEGKNDAKVILDSFKITMGISRKCKRCNCLKETEIVDFFLMVPLDRNVDNIFLPFHEDLKVYRCEICNDLGGNQHQRMKSGATQITEIKSFSKYVLVKFGRVKPNYGKITYNVTLQKTSNVLGSYLSLEAWVEHIGNTIHSGHYVCIRRMEQGFIKISDENISNHSQNYIEKCKLCYIALLRLL